MEVRLFSNLRRPAVGLKPRREAQRPLLPQHARHCPVLEAGSSLGFLVYPPLESHESFHVGYLGDGRYRFLFYYANPADGEKMAIFQVTLSLPVGGVGQFTEDVTFQPGMPNVPREFAQGIVRQLIVLEDLGTPAGGITLRGAWNFQTPPGWDSVYTPVFNSIERPIAPMLVIRVETDWYAHESEFRYILQPGEGISVERSLPIGEVFFVPREQVTVRDCSEDELAAIHRSRAEFASEKAASRVTTSYGMPYSPHYSRKSRSLSQASGPRVEEVRSPLESDQSTGLTRKAPVLERLEPRVMTGPQGSTTQKVGRNDPCPCGSGKKYKKCHGEG
jgi:hypothetical protein